MDGQQYNPTTQQTGYDLTRRTYRMRSNLLEEVERAAKSCHVSKSKMLNDICEAALRYILSGDSLALTEIRSDLQNSRRGRV